MLKPKGRNLPIVKQLAATLQAGESNMKYAGLPESSVRATIYDVDDPENRGRVRVLFDDFSPDVPEVQNAGESSGRRIQEGAPQLSHWIDTMPSFKGKQPKGLIGKRVGITITNRQFRYAILSDVIYDPETLTQQAGKAYKQPNNSSMTRLPIYGSGELPPPCEENHGCMVIEEGGPMSSDWLCVCLKRNGQYIWVRHVDLQHGHAGENDGKQPPDSAGDIEPPVDQQSIWDYVFPTSAQEMPKTSAYGTAPRDNPYGGEATWNAPP
jgi:hypothetical protein